MSFALHGLSAYTKINGASRLYIAARVCEKTDAQICVSDKAIGPVGVLLECTVHRTFWRDVWSWVKDGIRVPSEDREHNETHLTWEEAVRINSEIQFPDYLEGFATGQLIRAVWVKKWASPEFKRDADRIAAALGVPCWEIEPGQGSWMGAFCPEYLSQEEEVNDDDLESYAA